MDWILQNGFFILGGIFIANFAVTGWLIFDTRRKVNSVFGKSDGSLAGLQQEFLRRLARTEAGLEEIGPRLEATEANAEASIQKVGFLRYNPFTDTGGDNSFTVALLDRDNNGVIISSLYMREGTRMYAKEIRGGSAKQQLSEEEQKVLGEAINRN